MKKPYIFPLLLGSLVLTGCANGQIDAMQMRLNQHRPTHGRRFSPCVRK